MMRFNPPQLRHDALPNTYRPNWPLPPGATADFINDEHKSIYDTTKDLPGWQDPGDSLKLYEAAYHSGSVILEIGVFGGRSAAVELKGALAAHRDHGSGAGAGGGGAVVGAVVGAPPQFYGVDPDPAVFARAMATLEGLDLASRALLYTGDFRQFIFDLPIIPTMVFVDGSHQYDGVWADLEALSRILVPGTPVMCHDYSNPDVPGVRKAIDEWCAEPLGAFELWGVSQNTAVLRAGNMCQGKAPRGLTEATFRKTADALAARYRQPRDPGGWRPDVAHLTHDARRELGVAVT